MTAHPPSDPAAEAEIALREALAETCYELSGRDRRSRPWIALNKHDAWDRHIRMKAFLAADALLVGPLAPLLADIAALRTRAKEAERERDEHELRADRLERERRLIDARVHHQRVSLREIDATACRIKELERDRGRAWTKACARKADLLALARMYGEACRDLMGEAEGHRTFARAYGDACEALLVEKAARDTLAADLAESRAEVARLTAEREAAAYLIDRLQACHAGKCVRDLGEATSAYETARALKLEGASDHDPA